VPQTSKRFVREQVQLQKSARQQGREAGVGNVRMFHTPYALYQFSKLPDSAQVRVPERIPRDSRDEQKVFNMYLGRGLRENFANDKGAAANFSFVCSSHLAAAGTTRDRRHPDVCSGASTLLWRS
jgi:hypothetical protein